MKAAVAVCLLLQLCCCVSDGQHTFAGLSLDPVLAAVHLTVRLLFACPEISRRDRHIISR